MQSVPCLLEKQIKQIQRIRSFSEENLCQWVKELWHSGCEKMARPDDGGEIFGGKKKQVSQINIEIQTGFVA
jgi:hypothetical protein